MYFFRYDIVDFSLAAGSPRVATVPIFLLGSSNQRHYTATELPIKSGRIVALEV